MSLAKVRWAMRAVIYSIIFRNIKIPSYIGKPIYISNISNIKFGKRVRIYPGMRAELVSKSSKIIIGDNVSIGQNFHVVSSNKKLEIGNDVTIAGNVFITNCDHSYSGDYESILDNKLVEKDTCIGEGCFIGNNVAILAGTILGSHCVVGANSVVRGNFDSGSIIVGAPAKKIKSIH